eukprot:m.229418 g.229418  ORF g.229418 m.229418 type:complete len:76 (+) comp40044_c0_seq2:2714-2941(+)
MHGYSFLFSADNTFQYKNAVFINAVSALGSCRRDQRYCVSSEMPYYQRYCVSSATAFLLCLIERNLQLFNSKIQN